MADRGTLFLDEIGDMKIHMQVKLLRIQQNKELDAVGATRSKKIGVRFIAPTNQNLERCVEMKKFREDLCYRFSVIPIIVLPLRERNDDIPFLLSSFRLKFNREKKRNIIGFDVGVMEILRAFNWPGNVRELENFVERQVVIKETGMITLYDVLEKYFNRRRTDDPAKMALPHTGVVLKKIMEELENKLIDQALEKYGGNNKEGAALLCIKRTTVIEKLKKKNIPSNGMNSLLIGEPIFN